MVRIASKRPARVQRDAGGGPMLGVGSSASSRTVSAATTASRSSAVGSGEMVIFNAPLSPNKYSPDEIF